MESPTVFKAKCQANKKISVELPPAARLPLPVLPRRHRQRRERHPRPPIGGPLHQRRVHPPLRQHLLAGSIDRGGTKHFVHGSQFRSMIQN